MYIASIFGYVAMVVFPTLLQPLLMFPGLLSNGSRQSLLAKRQP